MPPSDYDMTHTMSHGLSSSRSMVRTKMITEFTLDQKLLVFFGGGGGRGGGIAQWLERRTCD